MPTETTYLCCIRGGMTFRNHADYIQFLHDREIKLEDRIRWSDAYLKKHLGDICQIVKPIMPHKDNAKYKEWHIHFEKYLEQMHGDLILIGSSLGGIFLAKYLSENKLPKKALAVYLICPPYDNTLSDEALMGGFKLGKDLSLLQKNTHKLTLMFSQDDDVVHVSHAEKYRKKLPDAHISIYDNKNGHFKITEFPEIIPMLKKDILRK